MPQFDNPEGGRPQVWVPKSPLGKALTYINNQWECLRRYLNDPRLPLDNNQSERTIRPLVIGRRN